MPAISICIEMLFTEVGLMERPAQVAGAGFKAVEFWGWRGKDVDALRAACESAGVQVVAFSALSGRQMVIPQHADTLRSALAEDIEVARRFGTEVLIVAVGKAVAELSREQQRAYIAQNLSAVAPLAEQAGVKLAVEALNTLVDHAGYFLDNTYEARSIVDAVGSKAVGLLYDVYHMQIMEGNLIDTIRANADVIYHVHVGDVPGRHEPGTGEINYRRVFQILDEIGYRGWCGMEFRPTDNSRDALARTRAACGL